MTSRQYSPSSASASSLTQSETACVSAIKAAAKASENGGITSSAPTAVPTVGALIDQFALHLIYQPDWEREENLYVSNLGVLEPRTYIQQLLVLCLESSAVCSLADASMAANETPLLEVRAKQL